MSTRNHTLHILQLTPEQITRYSAIFILNLFLFTFITGCSNKPEPLPENIKPYSKFKFTLSTFKQRQMLIVFPEQAAKGKPWIWRARFPGHEPQFDIAMLERGYHLAYIDVVDLWGGPAAIKIWDEFYQHLIATYGLSPKVVLEGMSRGGLIIYNWASRNPEKTRAIYADAPICDITQTTFKHSILTAWNMSEQQAIAAKLNPIDNLQPLAKAGIPLIHVVGDKDSVVPTRLHSDQLESNYRQLGGNIKVIRKPDAGHHPHSLPDPIDIIRFIQATH